MSEREILTVDILLVGDRGSVLLIERTKSPYEDRLVMPGGHHENGESLRQAAQRELNEEVGILVDEADLEFLVKLVASDRDPRPGRRISYVFMLNVTEFILTQAQPASDAKQVHIVPLRDITPEMMGFDHYLAIEALRALL